jgi:hypothetical protein
MKMLPGAVATLQHDIALGERRAVAAGEQSITGGPIHFFHHKQPLETCARRRCKDPGAPLSICQTLSILMGITIFTKRLVNC